jgi:RHS repeat-associated protein
MKRGDDVYYYHANHLGSTMAVSIIDGSISERIEYDAYGTPSIVNGDGVVVPKSTIDNNILFTGREYDYEYSCYFYRARTFTSSLERFMQKDAFLYVAGMNDYVYTYNDPVNYFDPLGNYPSNNNSKSTCDKYDGPSISAAPYNGPSISAAPYNGPSISAAPPKKPEKSFCEQHPLICDPSGSGQGEHCNVIGVGVCFSGNAGLDKKGGNAEGGIDMAYGLYISGSAQANVGIGNSSRIDTKNSDELRIDLFVGSASWGRNPTNGDWEISGSIGFGKFGQVNGSVSRKDGQWGGSINGGAGVGGGIGIAWIRHRKLENFGGFKK